MDAKLRAEMPPKTKSVTRGIDGEGDRDGAALSPVA